MRSWGGRGAARIGPSSRLMADKAKVRVTWRRTETPFRCACQSSRIGSARHLPRLVCAGILPLRATDQNAVPGTELSRIAYVDGRYIPHRKAAVHVEDRGYQFADGVYEVFEVRDGRIVDERRHFARLTRSLHELRIRPPMARAPLGVVLRETVRRNRVRNGILYLQVTRGVARRDHAFPAPTVPPTVVVTARSLDLPARQHQAEQGIAVVSVPENRWERVDIKSVSLLANVLAKQAAREAGAKEAWFVDAQGYITEGSSTNAWIVTRDGR